MKCKIMLMTQGKLAESLSATAELICGEKVAFKNMPEVLDMQEYKKFINDVLDENKETGVCEILYVESTPDSVAINEAVELAKEYSTEKFILNL